MMKDILVCMELNVLQFTKINIGCIFYFIVVLYARSFLFQFQGFILLQRELRNLSLYLYTKNIIFISISGIYFIAERTKEFVFVPIY